ncbi:MAG: glutathione S-transferase [Calothrix sp. C42_A2020_038]|nr:glutathione S-transferase [Calothrix sp. C42_A2020_038]
MRLITIPISHYCEKVRWALDLLKISYIEECHSPPFHLLVTPRLGGRTTPILVTKDGIFLDSTDCLKYLDSIASEDSKLYPQQLELRQKAEELGKLFDEQLGVLTRVWGYSHVINDPELVKQAWCRNVPWIERMLFPVIFPKTREIICKQFNITSELAVETREKIQQIFEQVSNILADGRTYLVGDKLSAVDITFAALAAPTIAPPEHPATRGSLDNFPVNMAKQINQFRETPAGQFVLRLYRERK